MRFNADEIASVLQQEIDQYQSQIDVREVGRVLEVGDGIARAFAVKNKPVVVHCLTSAIQMSAWRRYTHSEALP